jgi:hypothetical protein
MVLPDCPSQGVLIDLDIAARVDDAGQPLDHFPLPYSGTVAFRALDLVQQYGSVISLYRYDLESFFYVLVWIIQDRTGVPPEKRYHAWLAGSPWDWMKIQKRAFISGGQDAGDMLPDVPEALDLLRRLRAVFSRGYCAYRYDKDGTSDEITLNGHVTYSAIMEVLCDL